MARFDTSSIDVSAGISVDTSSFTYDALVPSKKRKMVPGRIYREDYYTRNSRGRSLQANASDLVRNMSVCAWAVRRHLDYVSNFSFNVRNSDKKLNNQIERLMFEDSRKSQCDVAGRFGREKMFRIAEARRVVDGDCGIILLDDGRMQGIQADLIRDPEKILDGEDWINGVMVGSTGRHVAYGIRSRNGYTGTKYERRVNSTNVIHYGFFGDRFAADQVRGISPLTAALDPLRDLKDAVTLAQARAKVAALFAMAITRAERERAEYDDGTEEEREVQEYNIDLADPQILNMAPGDKAEFLESDTPSTEFQAFTVLVIQLALKALDLPMSLFDGSRQTFYGGRAEWLNYIHACQDKRADQIEMRRVYTVWKLRQWIRDGRLTLPRGMTIGDIDFQWISANNTAWWDKGKETRGDVSAVKAGLDTPQRICAEKGFVYKDVIDEIAAANEYAKSKGVQTDFYADPTQPANKAIK